MKLLTTLIVTFMTLTSWSQDAFSVRILQEGMVISPNGDIFLQKKPFKIEVQLNNIEGVYVYADHTDSIYQLNDKEPIPGFENLIFMAMAEELYNSKKELILNKEGWAYWYYINDTTPHRFDKKVFIKNGQVTATKSIEQFYYVQSLEEDTSIESTVKVKDVKEPLYLFFVAAVFNNEKEQMEKELQRYKLKINWQ